MGNCKLKNLNDVARTGTMTRSRPGLWPMTIKSSAGNKEKPTLSEQVQSVQDLLNYGIMLNKQTTKTSSAVR